MINQTMNEKILAFVQSHPGATLRDISENIGCSKTHAQRNMQMLVLAGRASICKLRDRSNAYTVDAAIAVADAGEDMPPKHSAETIKFFESNPSATALDLAHALNITLQHAQKILREFVLLGLIERVDRNEKGFTYSLPTAEKRTPVPRRLCHGKFVKRSELRRKALELENKKLWRRAHKQWLEVLKLTFDEREREEIIQRRTYCAEQQRYCPPAGYFS